MFRFPYFNPLHREGGDGDNGYSDGRGTDFNPLHREGGDYLYDNRCHYIYPISIHSTARVETLGLPIYAEAIEIAIHSTARVETKMVQGAKLH